MAHSADHRELKEINKQIRQRTYDERKQKIRRTRMPGNSKSHRTAIKIAKDEQCIEIPDTMNHEGRVYTENDLPVINNVFDKQWLNLSLD